MATRSQGPLPPRDSVRSGSPLPLVSARQKAKIVASLVLVLVFATVVIAVAPRPEVTIQGATYVASGCVASGTTQVVTATFRLVNQGSADGYVQVGLEADGTTVGSQTYVVLPHATTPGRINATLQGCSVHQFALTLLYVAPPAG